MFETGKTLEISRNGFSYKRCYGICTLRKASTCHKACSHNLKIVLWCCNQRCEWLYVSNLVCCLTCFVYFSELFIGNMIIILATRINRFSLEKYTLKVWINLNRSIWFLFPMRTVGNLLPSLNCIKSVQNSLWSYC